MTSQDWDVTAAEEEQRSRAWESAGRRARDDWRDRQW